MALYSLEEICEGCFHAQWHVCERCYGRRSFCHCIIDSEGNVDHATGECAFKTYESREPKKEA